MMYIIYLTIYLIFILLSAYVMWVKSIVHFSIYSIFLRLTAYHTKIYYSMCYLFRYLSTLYIFYVYLQTEFYESENFSVAVWEEKS